MSRILSHASFPRASFALASLVVLGFTTRSALAQTLDDHKDPFAEDRAGGASASAQGSVAADVSLPRESSGDSPHMLAVENTLTGPTGLLRLSAADSGATGTFRVSVIGTYYSGSGFLCPVCSNQYGTVLPKKDDNVRQIGTRFQLSATPVDFLEAFAALRFQSTSDDQGDPQAIQIVGDMTLGLKMFTPPKPDHVFTFGGGADLTLLSSPGSVGVDAASVGLRALGTADLTRRTDPNARIPLRIHVNAGYLFDGSGNLADDVEKGRAQILGPSHGEPYAPRITRVERFGHDINRVDSFRTGVGVEGVFQWVRPFAEWTIDIPVNRQDYQCGNTTNRTAGDGCLSNAGFSAVPSRLTLGARVYPWLSSWMNGLAVLAAVDIGTGATSSFIEEVAPELPWSINVGLAYAVDTTAHGTPEVVQKVVEKAAPLPTERIIEGTVTRPNKGEPIPNAIVRYVGRPITGMVTDDQGVFRTANLEPGEYRFTVSAPDFKDGECSGMVTDDTAPATPATAPATAATPTPPATAATPTPPAAPATPPAAPATPAPSNGPVVVHVACELEALPSTATITGVLRDADATTFVEGATVTITDPLGRKLALKTDAEGTFRFGNVPAGKSKITAEADGYLLAATDVTLEPRKDIATDIMIHKRPAVPNVVVTKTEIKLKKEIHFLHGSAEILPDSMALLEEAADVIRSHQELAAIEVQGHTDDTGTAEINLRLSADRANAVRDVLVQNGVDASRLSAHGYGQEKPLVPNSSEKNRAKNRRVQLVILQ